MARKKQIGCVQLPQDRVLCILRGGRFCSTQKIRDALHTYAVTEPSLFHHCINSISCVDRKPWRFLIYVQFGISKLYI